MPRPAFSRSPLPAAFTAALSLLVCATAAAPAARAQLFVTSNTGNTIYKFDTAGVATVFATGGLLNNPRGVAFDNLGRVYVANFAANNVIRYNTDGTGAVAFATTGLNGPNDLIFGPDGNLYVTNAFNTAGAIQRYSAAGASLGSFGPSISGPRGLDFDAAGNLYVSAIGTTPNAIFRIDTLGNGSTFATSGVNAPREITFAPDGTLYVVNNTGSNVTRYDVGGALLGTLPANGISNPQGLAIDPSGTVYVVNNSTSNQIRRYSSTGAVLTPFTLPNSQAAFGASFFPRALPAAAAPEPGSLALLGMGILPLAGMGVRRRKSKA